MPQAWTTSYARPLELTGTSTMSAVQAPLSALGRVMLSAIFLFSTLGGKIPQFEHSVDMMQAEGVPLPRVMLILAIGFLLVGSVSLMLGWYARMGAALLLVFLLLATYYFHDFWTMQGAQQQEQMIQFLKNTAMAGAMLLIMANGAGAGSIDAAAPRKAAEEPRGEPSTR